MSKKKFMLHNPNERQLVVNKCLNLESQHEQLKLFVKQLQDLSLTRENQFLNELKSNNVSHYDYIPPLNKVINNELQKAIKDQAILEKDIKSLKDKIRIFNGKLDE